MADEIDKAQEFDEKIADYLRSVRKPEAPAAMGRCLFCGEHLPDRRFCDAECRDFYDKERGK